MAKSTFQFTGRVASKKGAFISTVVYLPADAVASLPKGRVRVKGKLNNVPFALAIQFEKGGGRFFTVSSALRKEARAEAGSTVHVSFKMVDPDALDLPEEWEAVLDQDENVRNIWDGFTRGYQRSLLHYITSVKSIDARIKRALDLAEKMKARKLHGQMKKENKQSR